MINSLISFDNEILIGGESSFIPKANNNCLVLITTEGDLDTNFHPDIISKDHSLHSLAKHLENKVLVGGSYLSRDSIPINYLMRLGTDGSIDIDFSSQHPNGHISCLHVQPDSKILLGGSFTKIDASTHHSIARLNIDGSLDDTFRVNFINDGGISCIGMQADEKVLIGGSFKGTERNAPSHIARLEANGLVDNTFSPQVNSWVLCMVPLSNGKVLIGGMFSTVNDKDQAYLARLNTDGTLDASFTPDMGSVGWVYSAVEQADGKLIVSGEFTNVNGYEQNHITRLNIDGSVDTSFEIGRGADACVKSLCLQADQKLLIGGEFKTFNGIEFNHIARLNTDGSLDKGFSITSTESDHPIYDLDSASMGNRRSI